MAEINKLNDGIRKKEKALNTQDIWLMNNLTKIIRFIDETS